MIKVTYTHPISKKLLTDKVIEVLTDGYKVNRPAPHGGLLVVSKVMVTDVRFLNI